MSRATPSAVTSPTLSSRPRRRSFPHRRRSPPWPFTTSRCTPFTPRAPITGGSSEHAPPGVELLCRQEPRPCSGARTPDGTRRPPGGRRLAQSSSTIPRRNSMPQPWLRTCRPKRASSGKWIRYRLYENGPSPTAPRDSSRRRRAPRDAGLSERTCRAQPTMSPVAAQPTIRSVIIRDPAAPRRTARPIRTSADSPRILSSDPWPRTVAAALGPALPIHGPGHT